MTRGLGEAEASYWGRATPRSGLTSSRSRGHRGRGQGDHLEESLVNFAEHFNRGWLDYRKSVTEAGDWAATEWTGSGAVFRDVLGREYIDCLGGYGLLSHGWANPEVVEAVRAQLTLRTPMPSQELIDPLRGVLARLMAAHHAGRHQVQLLLRERH